MPVAVGVDCAKKTFDIALLQGNQKFRTKAKLANTEAGFNQFEQWLETHAEKACWVVMEATGIYYEALAEFLYARGFKVAVLNPAIIHAYGKEDLRRVKTDKADAKLIARYGSERTHKLREWTPEPPSQRRLRALVRRLEDLQEMRQMEANRLEVCDVSVQHSIRSLIDSLDEQIEHTRKKIRQHIDDDPDLRGKRDLIVSIDGLGDTSAASLLAELGDPLKYKGARAIVAFAGLNPVPDQSGEYTGPTPISKTGSARLRKSLYMPGIVASRHNAVIKAQSDRLKARGKAPQQIICAAMRKLLHLVYGVIKSGKPYDPKYAMAV
ncbi:IS110 family transposase [Pseudomonas cichorii]|uniref:IS110 family transposase n=1 Tax=Pseudomonas lijiangensis TaxID=2995658 RepID=A0ABX8HPL6_9PSED|nr:IS110 family transposase [Pseudomonas lijiangensis]MBX8542769.1 IS110 family transposase [Pseudomonas cichorii]MBX8580708.1 IS110 family transposase [Pseudomonas cichorii]QWU82500.1 IS110 family transposase [Pseudomonas lijiangensis]QWU83268.1 IS110 family transposase [Pseudomonas lijiangensis]QWU83871.1 IS110 family transposase [Pseudomonas lijiangensis]